MQQAVGQPDVHDARGGTNLQGDPNNAGPAKGPTLLLGAYKCIATLPTQPMQTFTHKQGYEIS